MKRFFTYILFLPLLAAPSCSKEHAVNPPTPSTDEKSVMLKVAVPHTASTRSIDSSQENTIETLDVLAFRVEGGVETFLYRVEAKKEIGSIEGSPSQSFSAALRIKDFPQRFVLITNAHSKVETLIGSRVDGWVGIEKETLLSQLTFDLKGGDRWNATGVSNYTAIPMWGQTAPKTIGETTTSISETPIPMLRMIAKIEVQLDQNSTGLTNVFKLKSVHVYNTHTSGRIVPIPGTEYIGTDMVAKKASLPASVTSATGPLAYTDFTSPGITDVAMKGAIYLFETAAKNAGNFLDETCIVVGGFYDSDTFESYYRLDFFAPDGTTHLDILRNNRYICNIIEVKGRGLPTVDDAWRTKSFNMKANILVWNEGIIPNVVIDGQYMLGVSHDRFELDGEARDGTDLDNILTITTNHPDGWTAAVWANKAGTVPATWLNISPSSGAGDSLPKEVRLLMGENPGSERTAYIHIQAGRLTYVVTVVQGEALPGTIIVTPEYISIPYIFVSGGLYKAQVICTKANGNPDPNASWTLTSADSWLKLSLNPNAGYGGAGSSVSGTGNQTVYLFAPDNLVMNSRRTTVYLGASSSDVVIDVIQYGNPGSITINDGAGVPVNARTYVGAFWRANETGERLIRIPVETTNTGAWTATVMWKDPRWGSDDGILIDTELLSNMDLSGRGISFSAIMNPDTFGTPEDYPVTNVIATGNAVSNGYIFFRIGLKSKYTPTANYPARYAIVLLSYNNNSKHQKIFLRQGQEPDYLMMPNDPVAAGSKIAKRTISKKFAVYNLTATTLNAQVAKRGAIFTNYPTQAGALWQWGIGGDNIFARTAFNPWVAPTPQSWASSSISQFWNDISAFNEASPTGFRRPNDGSITADEPCSASSIANSEFRQSLFWKVLDSWNYGNEIGNSVWGFYADGFFDRRRLTNGTLAAATNTVVAAGGKDIAYIGRLFFNPIENSDRYNASLFFPAAGWLSPAATPILMNTGGDGAYWSSSANHSSGYAGLGLIVRGEEATVWRADKATGASIRPVVE